MTDMRQGQLILRKMRKIGTTCLWQNFVQTMTSPTHPDLEKMSLSFKIGKDILEGEDQLVS